jgi:histidine phosphotransferase ChpT
LLGKIELITGKGAIMANKNNLNDIELAQYLNAKFCHELAGTIGAVDNGVEFLEEAEGEMKQKAVDLIKVSAKQSINRLLFYRNAYGIAKNIGEADLDDIEKLVHGFTESTKVSVNLDKNRIRNNNIYISTETKRLLLCLIVLGFSNLIRGGEIKIYGWLEGNSQSICVEACDSNYKYDEEKEEILLGLSQNYELSTNNVHYAYSHKLSKKVEAELSVQHNQDSILYTIKQEV